MFIECLARALNGIISFDPQKNPKRNGLSLAGRLKGLPKVTHLACVGVMIRTQECGSKAHAHRAVETQRRGGEVEGVW